MEKKIVRSVRILILTITAALFFSGFAAAGDTPPEKEAVRLMIRRAEAMQRAVFTEGSDADIYSCLAQIEAHPLLKTDMKAVSNFRDSDMDKVINIKVTGCEMKEKTANTRFFEMSVKWYLLGYDGYYTEEQDYLVRTVAHGRKMYLSDMEPL